MERTEPFRIYKANKQGNGTALSLDFNPERRAIFLQAAKQAGELKFDWEKSINMKLDADDIGAILAVVSGKTSVAKLFHQPSLGKYASAAGTRNVGVDFKRETGGYSVRASEQSGSGELAVVSVNVSEGEGEVIRVLFEEAVRRSFGW
jgi:hypothetical protein